MLLVAMELYTLSDMYLLVSGGAVGGVNVATCVRLAEM